MQKALVTWWCVQMTFFFCYAMTRLEEECERSCPQSLPAVSKIILFQLYVLVYLPGVMKPNPLSEKNWRLFGMVGSGQIDE